MAYTPKTWECGDTITAEDLNHLEQGVEDAGGYDCSVVENELYSGTTASTTSFNNAYRSDVVIQSDDLSADSIKVTFNGTEYEAEKNEYYGFVYYGATFLGYYFPPEAFDQYPFSIAQYSSDNGFVVVTKESSTNEITITAVEKVINTSDCFEEAVNQFIPKNIKDFGTGVVEGDVEANQAGGQKSHAEGTGTTASGAGSHAEGSNTTASGDYSHAEGGGTTASFGSSHAEGSGTTASGQASHAEGNSTSASGGFSHAEGIGTTASGDASHAEGGGTIANHKDQHVFGENNIADPSTARPIDRGTYIEIVGNGQNDSNRSNARTLDWSGNESLAGSLTLGMGTADETTVTATQLKALIALLNA